MTRLRKTIFALAALLVAGAAVSPPAPAAPPPIMGFGGILSVLTYNVKGLPWPIASDRGVALASIARRLRQAHETGRAPHIVLFQESFTSDARAVAAAAGYRYIADGPDADAVVSDRTAGTARMWWKGEVSRAVVGSGLRIASDFPIVRVRRIVFSRSACAGYDCLANKGALLVRVRVPGVSTPIDIVDTHLNSRGASGVADARADRAYARQVAALSRFIRREHDAGLPLIAGGDFNVGTVPGRRSDIARFLRGLSIAGPVAVALPDAAAHRLDLPRDAREAMSRAKDWQCFASGRGATLAIAAIHVPFGREPDGSMLSDHVGYVADYRIGLRQTAGQGA